MKKHVLKFLIVSILIILSSCEVFAPLLHKKPESIKTETPDGIKNLVKNAKKIIAGFFKAELKNLTTYDIPKTIEDIAKQAFSDNKLENMNIPDTVKNIGEGAFQNNRLKSINFGKGITNIGKDAFKNNKLQDITIPSSVQQIGEGAFFGNPIRKVTLSNKLHQKLINNQILEKIFGDKNKNIQYYTTKNTSKTSHALKSLNGNTQKPSNTSIPPKLKFYNTNNGMIYSNHTSSPTLYKKLVIKSGCTVIKANEYAKQGLTIIDLKKVTTIEKHAFENNKLTEVTIPNSLITIEDGAFVGNPLKKVTLSATLYNDLRTQNKLKKVFGSNVKNYYIQNAVSKINYSSSQQQP